MLAPHAETCRLPRAPLETTEETAKEGENKQATEYLVHMFIDTFLNNQL